MSGVRIEIKGISKAYQKNKPVLKPVDLTVEPGELFFLLGSSGCGKSTLLRIIAGLLKPDSGKILFNGKDMTDTPPEKRRAAMVFQNYALWPNMNVFENVAFGLRVAKTPEAEIRKTVREMLALVHLEDCADRKIQSLSGGQQQRVALARAMAVDPAVLLLDEPLSNLDACLRDEMRLEIRRICKSRGLTAMYVTHDRKEALSMADRIAVIHEGTLRQTGTPRELYNTPVESFVASFLGNANFLTGTVKSVQQNTAKVETQRGVLSAPVPEGMALASGQQIKLMIRPENLSFEDRTGHGEVIVSTLESGTYLGERTEWLFRDQYGSVTVYETLPPHREPGTEYKLYAEQRGIAILRGESNPS